MNVRCYLAVVCMIAAITVQAVYGQEGDVSARLNALEVMLAEEKQLRSELESQVDRQEQRLAGLESYQEECGCGVESTGHPAFMAGVSNDLLHCSLHQHVVFDSIKINQGDAYDNNHGVFKAPITGTYMFTSTLSVTPQNSYHVAMVKNNATNEIGYLYTDPIDLWLERSTSVVIHLDKDDEVWMVCLSDSRIEGNKGHSWGGAGDFHSHFAGFLISADEYDPAMALVG